MIRACVIGWPVAHSRSPLIHGFWLARYGIDGTYTKEAVRPEDVTAFLASLGERGLSGCNVTLPHKEAAFRLAHETDAAARAAGAVNTLWHEGLRLCGSNTDTYGFMTYLAAKAPDWTARDAPVAILGAGGAARAIVFGFLEAGAPEVRVFNRTAARAEALARHFGPRVRACAWSRRAEDSAPCSVLVNTTSAGLSGADGFDMDFSRLRGDCIVADVVYVPLETPFLHAARAAGLSTVDGLGMLLHQAVPGFERWFGTRPEVTADLYRHVAAGLEAS